jgi:hypothetical protein
MPFLKCILYILLFILVYVFILTFNDKSGTHISGFTNKPAIYYIYPSDVDPLFKSKASEILNKSDWHKYHTIIESGSPETADIHIHLVRRKALDKYHDKVDLYPSGKRIRWSITTQGRHNKPQVFIDEFNWLEGVPESGLSVDDYRTYVVNHEFGHGLGYDHVPCDATTQKNGVCPVMYQSTRGCKNYKCGVVPIDVDLRNRIDIAYLQNPPK